MKDESEEVRLMGDKSTSNFMSYTDGPRDPLATAAMAGGILDTAPPTYEKTTMGGGSNYHGNENGRKGSEESDKSQDSELISEFMNYSGSSLMTQFHADVLKQIGFGKCQKLVVLVTGLALAAHGIQLFSIFFVFPFINLEFCLRPNDKETLLYAHLMGAAVGAMMAGSLADMNGRKWTLLSCLLSMTLFSVVSAFMPTFHYFMLTRFIASLFAGGVLPIGATLVSEMTPDKLRGLCVSLFASFGFCGSIFAGLGALIMLPTTGEAIILEHREHFSAWHRYLLSMALSSLLPIIGLFFLPESPRWLLDIGREVEALEIYQKIFCANRTNDQYRLTELELPQVRSERKPAPQSSVLSSMLSNIYQFGKNLVATIRKPYGYTSMLLQAIWLSTMFFTYGLTSSVLRTGQSAQKKLFHNMTIVTYNSTLDNIHITRSILNQNFEFCHFFNVTFEQIFMSYVQFINCTLIDCNFHGVKIANTMFVNSFLNNVKFIDTNVGESNFVNSIKNNTEIDRMTGGCQQQFEVETFNTIIYHVNVLFVVPSVVLMLWVGLALNRFGRGRIAGICIAVAAILSAVVAFICLTEQMFLIMGVVQALILSALMAITIYTLECFTTLLRCTAVGAFNSIGIFAATTGIMLFHSLPEDNMYIPSLITATCLLLPWFCCKLIIEPKTSQTM